VDNSISCWKFNSLRWIFTCWKVF